MSSAGQAFLYSEDQFGAPEALYRVALWERIGLAPTAGPPHPVSRVKSDCSAETRPAGVCPGLPRTIRHAVAVPLGNHSQCDDPGGKPMIPPARSPTLSGSHTRFGPPPTKIFSPMTKASWGCNPIVLKVKKRIPDDLNRMEFLRHLGGTRNRHASECGQWIPRSSAWLGRRAPCGESLGRSTAFV